MKNGMLPSFFLSRWNARWHADFLPSFLPPLLTLLSVSPPSCRSWNAGLYASYYNGGNIPLELFLPFFR